MKINCNKIVLLFALLLPIVANAYNFEEDGIYYNIVNSSNVTVTYKDNNYNSYSGEVNIPETVLHNGVTYAVKSIGSYAFKNCIGLTSITIPNSINSIGDYAFSHCTGLASLTIPNSITSIGGNAFEYCSNMTAVDIGNSVISIGTWAFYNCTSLTNVDLGNSVQTLGAWVFEGCSNLESIIIPSSVRKFTSNPFSVCNNLKSLVVESENPTFDSRDNCNAIIETNTNTLVVGCCSTIIPNSVTAIGKSAFRDFSFTNMVIPNSVTSIGEAAFAYCRYLASIKVPKSVTTIGNDAFWECKRLNYVEIPNSLTSIGSDLFFRSFVSKVIDTIIIYGDGDWLGGSLSCSCNNLYLDSHLSSLNSISINASNIFCYSTTPPICDDNTFTDYSGTLHVPAASLAAYFTAPYWCNFGNIIGNAVEPNVSIDQDSIEIQLGNQYKLTALVSPADAYPKDISWESTNTAVATVNNGTITAVGSGECDIMAWCLYESAICHVIVKDTTFVISLNINEAQVLPNHIITLIPSSSSDVLPALAVNSSAPSVAAARIVNDRVQVVGIKEGMTVITVGSADGTARPATCLVTVYTEPGDLNSDGFVNISDVTSLINYLLSDDDSQISEKNADVNGDNIINISDVTTLINNLLRSN